MLKLGVTKFILKDDWGKQDALKDFFFTKPSLRVKLDSL